MTVASSPPRLVPVLRTARLVLRGHTAADLDACAAMWADPRVTCHIGGRPATREETWARILRYAGLWALLGYGYWAIVDRGSGRFLGEVGFAEFRRALPDAMLGAIAGAPEVGWALAPDAHGRGYATEALRAVLHWGDAHLRAIGVAGDGPLRSVALIAPANAASLRVAAKCGFREIARGVYRDAELLLLERSSCGPCGHAPAPGARDADR